MKKNLLWSYGFFVVWGVITYLLKELLPVSPLILTFSFIFLIFWPGFSLYRLLRFKNDDWLDSIVLSLALGLGFSLLISVLAILIHINISVLSIIYFIVIIVLFLAAFLGDWLGKSKVSNEFNWSWREIFQTKNLIYLVVLFFVFLVYMTVERFGGFLTGGDSIYHLSLVRKAFENGPLSIQNLSYTPNHVEIAYLLPVWHVFLALLARIFDLSIFQTWREIAAPLILLSLLVWFWLFKKILPTRFLAILALLLFIIFYLRSDSTSARIFTTIPIPHSLSQLLLLPLSIGLALKFIFDPGINYKLFLLSVVSTLLFSAVHLQTLTYYFFLMLVLTLGYAAVNWNQKDYWPTLKKLLMATFAIVILLLPVLIFLELKSHLISENMKSFANGLSGKTVNAYNIYTRYAFIFLPIIFLFLKKHRWLIFVIMMMLLAPIIYIPVVKTQLVLSLGPIFTKRLYGNVTWYFMVWALVWGFALIMVDRLISQIKNRSKLAFGLVNVVLAVGAVISLIFSKNVFFTNLDKTVFGSNIREFLIHNGIWLCFTSLVVAVLVLVWGKFRPKVFDFFSFTEPKNGLPIFFLTLILVMVLFLPDFYKKQYFNKFKKKTRFLVWPIVRPIEEKYAINFAGGSETVDFIKNNIPSKSVFEARGGFFYLPAMTDIQMWTYSTGAPWAGNMLYKKDILIQKKLRFLAKNKIEYILITNPKVGARSNFDPYPANFKNIYQTKKAIIYQVKP